MVDPDRRRPWKVLRSTYAVADQWLRLRNDVVQSPDGRTLPPCLGEVIHCLEMTRAFAFLGRASDLRTFLKSEVNDRNVGTKNVAHRSDNFIFSQALPPTS
jgi:hypothetical protein